MVIKEQIMLTAFDLFSEHGIKNVSMDDIAHIVRFENPDRELAFEDIHQILAERLQEFLQGLFVLVLFVLVVSVFISQINKNDFIFVFIYNCLNFQLIRSCISTP